ncbi:S8 family serine peptidase [Kamptonema cortianum]|nr:S8 family serine peptidase [Kamptonema cortianum]
MTQARRIVRIRDGAPQYLLNPSLPDSQTGARRVLSLHERTGASAAFTGRGVTIAFIDSGFYPHPDLDDRVLAHVDATDTAIRLGTRFSRGNRESYVWHGQMTSVIAAGSGRQSGGLYRGLAPDARLVLIKVSDRHLRIKERDILRGMRWLIAHAHEYNVRVLNISVGGDFQSQDPDHPLHRAVEKLTELGVTVVISAGNRGAQEVLPPASAASAITVGGYDDSSQPDPAHWQLYHHSYGAGVGGVPKPEVLAVARWVASPIVPGSKMARRAYWLTQLFDLKTHDITRAMAIVAAGASDLGLTPEDLAAPTQLVLKSLKSLVAFDKLIDAQHQHVDGTSVASAVAAAVVAQMIEANPRLTPHHIKAILMRTALKLPDAESARQGAGAINASAVVRAALNVRDAELDDKRTDRT